MHTTGDGVSRAVLEGRGGALDIIMMMMINVAIKSCSVEQALPLPSSTALKTPSPVVCMIAS